MMLAVDAAHPESVYMVVGDDILIPFSTDGDAFTGWFAEKQVQLKCDLLVPNHARARQTLSKLTCKAISADVLVR